MAIESAKPTVYGPEIRFTGLKTDSPQKGKTTITYSANYLPQDVSLFSTTNLSNVAFSEKIKGLQFKPDVTGTNFVGSVSFPTGPMTEAFKIIDPSITTK